MSSGETAEQIVICEVKKKTDFVKIIRKIGDREKGVQAGLDYDYYPTCFVVVPISGNCKKQDSEISEIRL